MRISDWSSDVCSSDLHVMGLQRLYWVPDGMTAERGAYVRYPFQELLRIVALESRRRRCIVVGEDLGTVPEGFRPAMAEAGILSYRVMQFERTGDGLFKRAGTDRKSVVSGKSVSVCVDPGGGRIIKK